MNHFDISIHSFYKAIREKSFWRRVFKKIRIFYVPDEYSVSIIERCSAYRKLSKKYNHILKNKISIENPPQKSNKVWICWFQGYHNAPPLVKACINSIKMNMPDKDVIILSDDNIADYVSFPEPILQKRKLGIIKPAHFSDLLRVELLCEYGGLWVDATVLCTSPEITSYISSMPLFVYKHMDLTKSNNHPTVASSWLIAARTNQRILLLTRALLYAYWEKEDYLIDYFLFHIFFAMAARTFKDDWSQVPMFNNCSPHTLQFELDSLYSKQRWIDISKISSFHKLNHHINYEESSQTFYQHILRLYLPSE